jgi:catechol 2,3-dioxygenase-like lactoylglutathione lyase family enzyme
MYDVLLLNDACTTKDLIWENEKILAKMEYARTSPNRIVCGGNKTMKYSGVCIAVSDMEKSKAFYKNVFGLNVELDFGANVMLTSGLALQTLSSWREWFIGGREVMFRGLSGELAFETEDFDAFEDKLAGLELIHPPMEQLWGQRVVRFYDPDGHMIEVGEAMSSLVKRLMNSGMSVAETAARIGAGEDYVRGLLENL